MIFVPYPLKMDAKGILLPKEPRYIFPQEEGFVREIKVRPRDLVAPNAPVARLQSFELQNKVIELKKEMEGYDSQIISYSSQLSDEKLTGEQKAGITQRMEEARTARDKAATLLKLRLETTGSDLTKPGWMTVKAPQFERARQGVGIAQWRVISPDRTNC